MKAIINRKSRYPIIDGVCFTIAGYTATQDIRTPYLGVNRGFDKRPTVTLSAIFQDVYDVEMLMKFWRAELDEGQSIFMTQIEIFGKNDMYGLRQITPIVHTKPNGVDKVTFTCEVMFDSSTILNTPPVVQDMTIHVRKNSIDNFITLMGSDKEGDPLTFEVQVGTGIGTLSGAGNNLYYSPDHDVEGTDCFSFVARDYWGVSAPAVATVIIDAYGMPDTEIEYIVTGDIAVSGNYFYDLGDGVWHRGTGGVLTPLTNTILIRSNDHKVNATSKQYITSVLINKWGDRTDWSELCGGSRAITQFGIVSTAGVCKATNVDDMFHGSGVNHIISFDMSKVVTMERFAYVSLVTSIGDLDLSSVEDISRAFSACPNLTYVGILKTPNCKHFDLAFASNPKLNCLGGIDTRNKVTTTNMFSGTSALTNPNKTTEQGAILNGSLWLSKVHCLFNFAIPAITHVGETQNCHLASTTDKCKSKGQYKVNLAHPAPAGTTYTWTSNATITAGQGTDTLTVETAPQGGAINVWVQCVISQGGKIANTGHQVFHHTRSADFLMLTLPKSYASINLRAFIDANNPSNKKRMVITNNVYNCHIDTGNLAGLDVTLVNNSTLAGFPIDGTKIPKLRNHGLSLSSDLKLINNGVIYGAGGWGGQGGKGKDIPAVITWNLSSDRNENIQYKGNGNGHGGEFYSGVYRWRNGMDNNNVAVHWFYRSNKAKYIQKSPNVVETSFTFYEANKSTRFVLTRLPQKYGLTDNPPYYKGIVGWQMNVKIYNKRVTPAKIGGVGGAGGHGIGYELNAQGGNAGALSRPAGGYSGGYGGLGGDWGTDGYRGNAGGGQPHAGAYGTAHANAVTGKAHLVAGSKVGKTAGGVV